MIIELLTYLFRLVLILLVQLLIVNNISLSTYVNPFIYIIFIFTLPYKLKPWAVVIISFILGGLIDTFTSTPGLHMAATTFMGYLRGFYLKFAANKEDLNSADRPSLQSKGAFWFVVYIFILTLAHHFVLFYIESYSIREVFRTFLRVISSTAITVLLILAGQLLFYKSNSKG